MTELPSTETNSTLTLQNATWLTTTSGEYDVGPSLTTNVKWLIFAISVIILIVIVCLFVFKRFYLRYRHESNEFHLFSNTPLFPLNELKKHSLPSGNMPDEEFSEPPACCAKGFPVEIQSEKVCNLRLLGTPSTKECDQLRDRIDDCVNSFVRATDREHSNSYEAPLSGINVVAATPLTSTPHQTSMNGALWFPTATVSFRNA